MTIRGQLVLKLLCSFTVATWAVRNDEGPNPKPEAIEPKLEEVTKVDPIPGSQTWYKVNNVAKSVHKCGNSQFCCMRGCRYIVELDKCGECQGHNVKQLSPAEEIKQYQATMRKFRIPSGMDNKGPILGCWKKNAGSCIDKDQKAACCCMPGFNFDFDTRQCVSDGEDPSNKEEPIPGTEAWGIIYGKARKKTFGLKAKKCAWHPKKWCCNRGCTYQLENDKCGQCKFDDGSVTPPKEVIKRFIAENGNYVIPRSIAKPGPSGICWVKHSKRCVAQGSTQGLCCCYSGFYFSFASRRCLDEAAEAQAAAAAEGQSDAQSANAAGNTAGNAATLANDDDLKRAMSRSVSGKDRGGASHTSLSLALLVLIFTLWR